MLAPSKRARFTLRLVFILPACSCSFGLNRLGSTCYGPPTISISPLHISAFAAPARSGAGNIRHRCRSGRCACRNSEGQLHPGTLEESFSTVVVVSSRRRASASATRTCSARSTTSSCGCWIPITGGAARQISASALCRLTTLRATRRRCSILLLCDLMRPSPSL